MRFRDHRPRVGIQPVNTAHRLTADALAADLGTRRIGRRIFVFDELPSTNTHALETLAADPANAHAELDADGAVIFAEHQTAGRGRLGRRWHSPRGASLMFTVLLLESVRNHPAPAKRQANHTGSSTFLDSAATDSSAGNTQSRHSPFAIRHSSPDTLNSQFSILNSSLLPLAVAVALAEAVHISTGVECLLRWPNDLYVGPRKLAGILIESRSVAPGRLAVAVGIGVNCLQHAEHFPPELRDRATSLDLECHRPIDRIAVARAALQRLDALLREPGTMDDKRILGQWKARSADLGQRVTLVEAGHAYSGSILDVDPVDGLLLQLDTGARRAFHPATTSRI